MYHVKLFREDIPEFELEKFLNQNNIQPENIISITMGCDANSTQRWGEYAVNQILLVYIE